MGRIIHGIVDIFEKYMPAALTFLMVIAVLVGSAAIYCLTELYFEKYLHQTLSWPAELAVSMIFFFLTIASVFAMIRESHKAAAIVDAVFSFVFAYMWQDFFSGSFAKLIVYAMLR